MTPSITMQSNVSTMVQIFMAPEEASSSGVTGYDDLPTPSCDGEKCAINWRFRKIAFLRPRKLAGSVQMGGIKMPMIDADRSQRVTLKINSLAIVARRHAHISHQHVRQTLKRVFSRILPKRQGLSIIVAYGLVSSGKGAALGCRLSSVYRQGGSLWSATSGLC